MINYKKNYPTINRNSGFTLVELLLVIGIIAVLAVVVFVALDPAKRFSDARDARRTFDVETILNAIQQYTVDNRGIFPPGVVLGEFQIGTSEGDCSISTRGCNTTSGRCLNIAGTLAKYLKDMPVDPIGTAEMTRYTVSLNENNIMTVRACGSEGNFDIAVSR